MSELGERVHYECKKCGNRFWEFAHIRVVDCFSCGASEADLYSYRIIDPNAESKINGQEITYAWFDEANSLTPGMNMRVNPGYERLFLTFQDALNQAQSGKGKERHANGQPFDKQDICQEARDLGLAYPIGQARKKAKEVFRLLAMETDGDRTGAQRAMHEVLGAINYLAAAYIVLGEMGNKDD